MSRIICALITLSIPFLQACVSEESAPKPVILTPENHKTFYPDQLIEIKWEADPSRPIDMQLVISEDEHFFDAGELVFDTLTYHDSFFDRSSYAFYMSPELDHNLYYGYRIRYKGSGKNGWTPAQYFNIFPYAALDVKYATIKTTFTFETQENNTYWSGLVVSDGLIDLNQTLSDNGFDLSKLELVKFDRGFVLDDSDFPKHLARVVIGVGEEGDATWPFDVWGDVYALEVNDALTFYPFGGVYRNIRDEIGGKQIPLKLAYFLSTFNDQENQLGIAHKLHVEIRLRCYFRK